MAAGLHGHIEVTWATSTQPNRTVMGVMLMVND